MCQHCDRPPCTDVCPTSATYLNPEGIVAQIYPRCIGCRYCTNACPYAVKAFTWTTPRWPDAMEPMRNPDVSVRPKGVVEKCTFCHHRLIEARERARAEAREMYPEDYVPACVQTCPAEAMTFGDLDDPHGPVASLAESPRAFRWMEELGTRPKVVYLREGD
jgi:molybdopterin-containing oxidoreductase family iron-sulfur binding subunit